MLTLYIRNTRTKNDIADYEYIVMVNAEKIAEGTVKGHRRSDGWAPLVKRIVEQEGKMDNGWTKQAAEFDEIKARVKELFTENEQLKKENRELRADRDFLRQALDQKGGEG